MQVLWSTPETISPPLLTNPSCQAHLTSLASPVLVVTELMRLGVQVSNDVRMLLPLLVGILVAKWVADAVTHSLYHALLEVACVPWLPPAPAAPSSMDLISAASIMASPVITLPQQVTLGELRNVLRDSRHNGFPVVRPTPAGLVSTCQC